MAKTAIDELGWLPNLILTIFFDPVVQGLNRILRGRLIVGILWIVTGGVFCVGWIIDIVTVIVHKRISFLA
jgi:tryptophan-rich sensory protein